MSTLKELFGSNNQTVVVTSLVSLANSAYCQSAFIDNSTDLFNEILVTVKAKGGASGVASTGQVEVFAAASADGGTSYDGSCTGGDAGYSPPVNNPNIARLGSVNITGNGVTDQRTFSIAQAFGGAVPEKFSLVFFNNTGAALASSGMGVWYQGIKHQTV